VGELSGEKRRLKIETFWALTRKVPFTQDCQVGPALANGGHPATGVYPTPYYTVTAFGLAYSINAKFGLSDESVLS
jgi:hypothetical protein